jgi:D-alanyl-D-alanine carboxypeptidase (penicillin-binding protein 5/6)
MKRAAVVGAAALLIALLPGSALALGPDRDDAGAPPQVAAAAVAIVDAHSGTLLYGAHAHERRAQASLTKLTTALVALRHAGLNREVRATERSRAEPAVIGMEPGDVLSLHDATYGLLLLSGNDVALAMAESVGGGSIARFVGWMNQSVAEMGLRDTHFVNPNGLDAAGHYSSAYDVAQIGRAVLRDPFLSEVVSTQRYEVAGPPLWVFRNINPLLGRAPGVDGIKTGYETDAGHCIAVSATRDGHRVVVVILHDDGYVADAGRLLDWTFQSFRWWGVRVPDERGWPTDMTVVLPSSQQAFLRAMVRLEHLSP